MSDGAAVEYRIGELAAEAGIPVRTLRYYQERGLLPRPRRQGRVGMYSAAHLERLRLIAALLERGYRLDGIEELLAAAGEGREVTELLGLERAAGAPWAEPGEVRMSRQEAEQRFGGPLTDEVLAESVELGYVRLEGDELVHTSPRLLAATVQLVEAGIPLKAVVSMGWELQAAFDRVAYGFVRLVRTHLLDPALADLPPSPTSLSSRSFRDREEKDTALPGVEPERGEAPGAASLDSFPQSRRDGGKEGEGLAGVVAALRPVARAVADEHFARAMDARVRAELADLRERLR
ncbi:MerR family transcriptional regulator [Actinocorallia sp. A-T 12471]|uniref:MerR family transcriptional regulator n=1 Tax=Actinocorallia sp. A-T 12471 TaxID=3089813 RepID=UPI0029CBEF88|nr:MerR family transcriptional regulator [Actinocorallia sp. A-T 12471]MDX6739605.1 MerR family transcriptional regulator [Actinocorallia sp. A-T 12471]